jgi:NADH-quinone oxidoreductase subunit N
MLIGLSVWMAPRSGAEGQWNGVAALLFYLATYAVATVGTFAGLACLGGQRGEVEDVDELAGLAWSGGPVRRVLAWVIALFMLSLAGIPPLFGFWGKLTIFASALSLGGLESYARPWFVALAVIGVVNSAIAAAYYLRIVGVMFFRLPLSVPPIKPDAGPARCAALGCAAMVVVLGLLPGLWLGQADSAAPRLAAKSEFGTRNVVSHVPSSDFPSPEPRTLNPEP